MDDEDLNWFQGYLDTLQFESCSDLLHFCNTYHDYFVKQEGEKREVARDKFLAVCEKFLPILKIEYGITE